MNDGADEQPSRRLRLKRGAYAFYVVSFAVIAVLTVAGFLLGLYAESVVGIPMLIILGYTIFLDRRDVHVPPEMILLVILAFFLSFIARVVTEGAGVLEIAANVLTGVNLGLLGLIMVYIVIGTLPENRTKGKRAIGFIAVCIAIATYAFIRLLQYVIVALLGADMMSMDDFMQELIAILVGAAIVAIVHASTRRKDIFGGILNSFLEENSELVGIEDAERQEVERIIEDGESEWTEFKSTLRTNLQTGEQDKRMEKAVLKTIVAFLNSEGGNLLIGVADDGEIIGADVDSFENRDKMALHLSNIISAQIGSGFLPFINVRMVDFDDRMVIRVKCAPSDKPVFLKDGKIEMFYVRKGPQSEELTGNTLLSYVDNRWAARHRRS